VFGATLCQVCWLDADFGCLSDRETPCLEGAVGGFMWVVCLQGWFY
jgi:hypothetical protein